MKKLIPLIGIILLFAACTPVNPTVELAKCITDSGARMFGAEWCGHCKDQKEMFGEHWKHINYIECDSPSGQAPACALAGIEGYPTWEFGDGSRQGGAIPLSNLAELTGCSGSDN